MSEFENKLVSVMNKSLDPGIALNALGHMSLGFGAHLEAPALHLTDYTDADGGAHPYISKMPFIVLRANSNKIRGLRQQAIEKGIAFADFTDTMTVGTYQEQIYSNKLKSWEFGKEIPQMLCLQRAAVFIDTERAGDKAFEEKSTQPKTNSSVCLSIQRSKQTKEENLIYYGILLYGPFEEVKEMTRKFSLWK